MIHADFDALHSRGKSLEDAYFAAQDRQLAEQLKRRLNAEEREQLLAYSLGLTGELAHQGFANLKSGIEVVAAMALLPLVEVAWCDGQVSPEEKVAIRQAAIEMGMEVDSPLSLFLQNWIEQRPPRAAVQAWRDYVKAFTALVEPATAAVVKEKILGRAEKIARATGGLLGFGNRISITEKACLDELAKAFAI